MADEARWKVRLAALAAYRAAGQDWPRYKAEAGSEEHQLGVWLHVQRLRQRGGKLTPAKAQALNAAVPGWRAGRKPKTQSATKTSTLDGNAEPDSAATLGSTHGPRRWKWPCGGEVGAG